MEIIWKCKECGDIKESSSKKIHAMDVCKCGKSSMDLEDGYSRCSGDFEVIRRSENGVEVNEYVVTTMVSIEEAAKVDFKVFATSEKEALDKVGNWEGIELDEYDNTTTDRGFFLEDEWSAKLKKDTKYA